VINEATPTAAHPSELMKQLILEIVQALVDQPEDVSVEMFDDRDANRAALPALSAPSSALPA
jgi:hypothetical protein